MENLRRTLSYGAKLPNQRRPQQFFAPPKLNADVNECWTSSVMFLDALLKFCGASAHMAEQFTRVFENTAYTDSAALFHSSTRDLLAATHSVSGQLKSKLDAWFMGVVTRDEDHSHVLAKCYLNLIQLHCQFVVTSTDVLSQFCNFNNIEDMQSVQKQIPVVKVTNMEHVINDGADSYWNERGLQGQQTFVADGQSSKYGDIGSKVKKPAEAKQCPVQGCPPVKPSRSLPASPVKHESRRAVDLVDGRHGDSITEAELDNVINFLSGTRNCSNSSKPTHHLYNRGTMTSSNDRTSYDTVSMTSSLGHSLTSSSSSSSEVPETGSYQHRMSDGAIAEAVRSDGRNTWPYRGSNHGDHLPSSPQQQHQQQQQQQQQQQALYGSSSSLGSDPEFLNYVQSVGALIGQTSPIWSPQNHKSNRSWPTQKHELSAPPRRRRRDSSSSEESAEEEGLLNIGVELANNMETKCSFDDTGQRLSMPPCQPWQR